MSSVSKHLGSPKIQTQILASVEKKKQKKLRDPQANKDFMKIKKSQLPPQVPNSHSNIYQTIKSTKSKCDTQPITSRLSVADD